MKPTVSSRGNFSFKLKKLWFQADETLVPSGRNILFQRLELILELHVCTSLIMVDLFISNSCYVLTRNITNPGSCLLYYLLFLPPVYLF
ncbi:hypothetical protein F9Z91_17350, partial [Bacteroides thetaiotaomicron]